MSHYHLYISRAHKTIWKQNWFAYNSIYTLYVSRTLKNYGWISFSHGKTIHQNFPVVFITGIRNLVDRLFHCVFAYYIYTIGRFSYPYRIDTCHIIWNFSILKRDLDGSVLSMKYCSLSNFNNPSFIL